MDEFIIDYNEQMLNYYPEIIKAIREFQALIKTQSIQIEDIHYELVKLLANAYISTADEATITNWEQMLNITPSSQGDTDDETYLQDRRDVILARIYNVTKLNTKSIANVVKIFTGGTAISYFKDSTIHVLITPPKNNKQFNIRGVEQELRKKIPAHLMLRIDKNYYIWEQHKNTYDTWGDVKSTFNTWEDVLYVTLNTIWGDIQ